MSDVSFCSFPALALWFALLCIRMCMVPLPFFALFEVQCTIDRASFKCSWCQTLEHLETMCSMTDLKHGLMHMAIMLRTNYAWYIIRLYANTLTERPSQP